MALRMKTRWHRSKRSRKNIEGSSQPKSLEDLAGVMGFNLWKVAKEVFTHMENEGFHFGEDQQVVDILTELIAFLIQVIDRMLYQQVDEEDRAKFIIALAKHLAKTLESNQIDIHGEGDYITPFISTMNARFAEYAECGYNEEGPGYEFKRCLASHVSDIMQSTDNKWVVEYVMDIEVPKAVKSIQRLSKEILAIGKSSSAAADKPGAKPA